MTTEIPTLDTIDSISVHADAVKRAERRDRWSRRLPLLPALIFTIIVTQAPFVLALWYSLNDWPFLIPNSFEFTGLSNYPPIFTDQFFRRAVLNTIWTTFGTAIIATVIGVFLAVILDRKFIGRSIVRTALITPFLVMPVAASLIWRNGMLDATFGFFNYLVDLPVINWIIINVLRFDQTPIEFTSAHPLFSVMLVLVWQWTPFLMLILLAGLQGQSPSVLEAARVDGASTSAIFFQLTLPHLRRYIELGALLSSIYLIQTFDTVDQLVGGAAGAQNVPYFVYLRAIGGGFQFGQASAFGVVIVIASIIMANFSLKVLSGLLDGEEVV